MKPTKQYIFFFKILLLLIIIIIIIICTLKPVFFCFCLQDYTFPLRTLYVYVFELLHKRTKLYKIKEVN